MCPRPQSAAIVAIAATVALLAGASVRADCSRVIQVPAAPAGFNVQIEADRVVGVYPDLLRQLGEAAGCRFAFPVVPRARLALMFFETREADIFIPASRNAEREAKAQFVPMLKLTPALITLRSRADTLADLRALVEKSAWRAALVRTYSWGDEYEALLRQLEAEKRVDYVTDLRTVGQMLRTGRVEFTILPPTLLYSALEDGRTEKAEVVGEFRYQTLAGLPRSEVGAYLSRETLGRADAQLLRDLLTRAARDGNLQRSLERYYPAEILRHDVVLN